MGINLFRVNMAPEAHKVVEQVLASGFIGQGTVVEEFEKALEPWLGPEPVTVNSCTSAITLALRLAGVGPGTKVIATPMTCSASNIPILSLGAEPIWADIDPITGLIDVNSVAELMEPDVRAILAVDWGGQPVDSWSLLQIAKETGVKVIVDAAHSIGLAHIGADYTCYSFQAIKHLTTGDGGALICQSTEDAKRAKTMRWFGIDRTDTRYQFRGEQDITEWGYKFHMNDINAAIGLANLTILPDVLKAHRWNAYTLDHLLDERFGRTGDNEPGSWWVYTTLLRDAEQRDAFVKYAAANDLQASQVHWRTDHLSIFARWQRSLPGVDSFSSRMVCLPVHAHADPAAVAFIANGYFE